MSFIIAALVVFGVAAIALAAMGARSPFGTVRVAVELVPIASGVPTAPDEANGDSGQGDTPNQPSTPDFEVRRSGVASAFRNVVRSAESIVRGARSTQTQAASPGVETVGSSGLEERPDTELTATMLTATIGIPAEVRDTRPEGAPEPVAPTAASAAAQPTTAAVLAAPSLHGAEYAPAAFAVDGKPFAPEPVAADTQRAPALGDAESLDEHLLVESSSFDETIETPELCDPVYVDEQQNEEALFAAVSKPTRWARLRAMFMRIFPAFDRRAPGSVNIPEPTLLDSLIADRSAEATKENDDMLDDIDDLADGVMPLDAATAESTNGDAIPTKPTGTEVQLAVTSALASGDATEIAGVAELYAENEELRTIVTEALVQLRPAAETVTPIALAMLDGPPEDRQLAASLLIAVGMLDEAALVLGDKDPATRALLAARAIDALGEEKAAAWLQLHLGQEAAADALEDGNGVIEAAGAPR